MSNPSSDSSVLLGRKPQLPIPSVVLLAVGALSAVIGLAVPGWLYSPANPAAKRPALTFDFGDLRKLTGSPNDPTNGIQEAYFDWLAWTLVVLIIALVAASLFPALRAAGIAGAGLSIVALIIHMLAVKGPLTRSQFGDQGPNIRLGAYLTVAGFFPAFLSAVLARRTARA